MYLYFLVIYLLANNITFAIYGIDKYKAVYHKWRISEKTLLVLAFLGPFGGMAGMHVMRHKTKKNHFKFLVPIFLIIHIILLLSMTYWGFIVPLGK